jgi:hypothetical protein
MLWSRAMSDAGGTPKAVVKSTSIPARAVFVLGALLLVGGGLGYRVTSWVAVIGASIILLYGLFTVMQLFISSTGLGMWLVILASIASLGIGLFGVGRRAAN